GMPLGRLQETLAEGGHQLVVDDLTGDSTLGGAVATNLAGPRRMWVGATRDVVIGVRLVRADGTVAKAGGKVVKNVAGYDLSKLL
ncbi:FAD-binding protein, partial [Klebsiella pneumoniae]|nr:FAD-binding protein [Klebsiella pneumoniae]